ncbi:hypothetical protein AJ88_18780 [Mesorhizobium amorphae CCBAU 01583]|nr:hypothetical protein AJ88_18780 [Mesorhizobium amorphae CCBAU 01583]
MGLHPAFMPDTVAWPVSSALPWQAIDLDLTIPRRSRQFSSRDMQEISPLPNVGSELAIPPAEPIAPARPSAWDRKWLVAIIASCLLHAAVAAAF